MKYHQARADFEYLCSLAELDDQVELDSERENLMQNPTKRCAALMYESGVRLWFGEHGITPQTAEIADRHRMFSDNEAGEE